MGKGLMFKDGSSLKDESKKASKKEKSKSSSSSTYVGFRARLARGFVAGVFLGVRIDESLFFFGFCGSCLCR